MVEKKSPAQEIRELGNRLAMINGIGNVETPEQQPDNDTLVLASNPYGSSYEDLLAAKEK
tara:strand:- start:2197 stop:2376 length:180 start_codon:yes stop_codon:yes gene_type:complete